MATTEEEELDELEQAFEADLARIEEDSKFIRLRLKRRALAALKALEESREE